jgi:hypothetical protein
MSLDTFREKAMQSHAEAVARGEHDDQCEYIAHPYICHCSKRRREAQGFTAPPEDLIFDTPICPRCYKNVTCDGDSYVCSNCAVSWNADGSGAAFIDDYGPDAFDEKPAGVA